MAVINCDNEFVVTVITLLYISPLAATVTHVYLNPLPWWYLSASLSLPPTKMLYD